MSNLHSSKKILEKIINSLNTRKFGKVNDTQISKEIIKISEFINSNIDNDNYIYLPFVEDMLLTDLDYIYTELLNCIHLYTNDHKLLLKFYSDALILLYDAHESYANVINISKGMVYLIDKITEIEARKIIDRVLDLINSDEEGFYHYENLLETDLSLLKEQYEQYYDTKDAIISDLKSNLKIITESGIDASSIHLSKGFIVPIRNNNIASIVYLVIAVLFLIAPVLAFVFTTYDSITDIKLLLMMKFTILLPFVIVSIYFFNISNTYRNNAMYLKDLKLKLISLPSYLRHMTNNDEKNKVMLNLSQKFYEPLSHSRKLSKSEMREIFTLLNKLTDKIIKS